MKNRTEDQALVADLTVIYANQHTRVLAIVARTLREEDWAAYADDLAQDVWLMVWRYMLRDNEITRPPGLLVVLARSPRALAGVIDDIEREDERVGYEDAEDALRLGSTAPAAAGRRPRTAGSAAVGVAA